jgi:mannosyltransferase
MAVPWAVLPPAALLAVGLVHSPVYWPRYVTFTAPAVALLVGVAAAALPRLGTALAVVLLAAVAVPPIVADRQPRAKSDSELALAARLVVAERAPSDGPAGIVFGQYHAIPGVTTRIDAIAYPDAFGGLADLRALTPLAESTVLFGADRSPEAAVPEMRGLRTVWFLLDPGAEPATAVPVAAMRAIGLHQTGRFETSGSVLLRFGR